MQPSATKVQLRAVQETLEKNHQLLAELSKKGQNSAEMALCLQELNLGLADVARLWQLSSSGSSSS
jgi:hypothetical protein